MTATYTATATVTVTSPRNVPPASVVRPTRPNFIGSALFFPTSDASDASLSPQVPLELSLDVAVAVTSVVTSPSLCTVRDALVALGATSVTVSARTASGAQLAACAPRRLLGAAPEGGAARGLQASPSACPTAAPTTGYTQIGVCSSASSTGTGVVVNVTATVPVPVTCPGEGVVLQNSTVAGGQPTLVMLVTRVDLSPYKNAVVAALAPLGGTVTPTSSTGFCIPAHLITAAPAPAAAASSSSPLGLIIGAVVGALVLVAAGGFAYTRLRKGKGKAPVRRKGASQAALSAEGSSDDRLSTPRWASNPMARSKASLGSTAGLNEVFVAQGGDAGAVAPPSPLAAENPMRAAPSPANSAALLAATSVGAASPLARGPSGRLFTPVSKARTAMASPSSANLIDPEAMEAGDSIENPMPLRTAKKAFEPMAIHSGDGHLPGGTHK